MAPPKPKVFQYPKCSTCRKAIKWLAGRGIAYDQTDLVATPPNLTTLRDLHKRSGLPIARLFNTSGESYRAGKFKERLAKMTDAEALAALAADGKLIKRPILDVGSSVLVGFQEEAYAAQFAKSRR
jgi:arsenate reductase (glutaredoxin)